MRYGINDAAFFRRENDHLHDGSSDATFGTYDAIADDLARLGASVVRHVGDLQLYAGVFFPSEEADDERGTIPYLSDTELKDRVRDHTRFDDLASLVRYLDENDIPLKLYLTALVQSVSSSALGGEGAPRDGAALNWSPAWYAIEEFTSDHGEEWDLSSVDPSNGYKRERLAAIAAGIGAGLARVANDLAADGISLEEYVEGMEIGNELDVLDRDPSDGRADAASWAQLYYECALAVLAEAPWLRLKLPGMSSAAGPGTMRGTHAWDQKVLFISDFLSNLEALAGAGLADIVTGLDLHYYHRLFDDRLRPFTDGFEVPIEAPTPDRTARRAGAQSSDAQRLAYLAADVAELRGLIDSRFRRLRGMPITIFEIGVGVACPQGGAADAPSLDYDAGCEDRSNPTIRTPYPSYQEPTEAVVDYRPVVPTCSWTTPGPDPWQPEDDWNRPYDALVYIEGEATYPPGLEVGPNDFQAMSVWMRFAVAACAGAAAVGWHTLMSGADGPFAGVGLRRDLHDNHRPSSVALQRPAWWAFQRYVALLGGATGVEALRPEGIPPTQDTLHDQERNGSWSAEKDVWVIQYTLPVRVPQTDLQGEIADEHVPESLPRAYAYLLFVDPYGAASCGKVTLLDTTSEAHTVVQVATRPEAARRGLGSGPYSSALPRTQWVAAAGEDFECGPATRIEVRLGIGRYPVLLFSSSLLRVEGVETS